MAHEHIKIRGPIPSVDTVGTLGTIATVNTNSETAPQADYNLGRNSEAIKNLDQEQLRGVYKETDVGHANEESSPMNATLAQALNKEAGRENALYAAEDTNPNRRRNIVVAVALLVVILVVIIAVVASNGNDDEDIDDSDDSEAVDVEDEQAIVFNVGRLNGLCQSSGLEFVVCLDETNFFLCDAPQRVDVCPEGTTCACVAGAINAIPDGVDVAGSPFCGENFECGINLDEIDVVDDDDLSEIDSDISDDNELSAISLVRSCAVEGRVCTSDTSFASCVEGQPSEQDCAVATCVCESNIILKDLDETICSDTLFC